MPYRTTSKIDKYTMITLSDSEKILWAEWTSKFLVARLRESTGDGSPEAFASDAAKRADALILEYRKR